MKCSEDPHTHRGADGRMCDDNMGSSRENNDCLSWKIVMTVVPHSVLLCTRHNPKM